MYVLPLVGYLGLLLGFAFLTLAIASGLYYLSEVVEEHTVLTKKLLTRTILGVAVAQFLLMTVDRLPVWYSLLSIASHGIYYQNLRHFPIVRLTDPIFILSCILVVLNHYLWFVYFSSPVSSTHPIYGEPAPSLPSFAEVASFFFIQIWLVPFALFVSLSAGENVLPSMGSEYATDPSSPLATPGTGSLRLDSLGAMLTPRSGSIPRADDDQGNNKLRNGSLGHETPRGTRRRGAKGLVRVAVDGARDWLSETGEAMGFWRGERTRRW